MTQHRNIGSYSFVSGLCFLEFADSLEFDSTSVRKKLSQFSHRYFLLAPSYSKLAVLAIAVNEHQISWFWVFKHSSVWNIDDPLKTIFFRDLEPLYNEGVVSICWIVEYSTEVRSGVLKNNLKWLKLAKMMILGYSEIENRRMAIFRKSALFWDVY